MKHRIILAIVLICSPVSVSSATFASEGKPPSISEDITASLVPAFISGCTFTKDHEFGERFESVAFVYTGPIGWVIVFDKQGKEHFLANSDPEYLVPFAWDFAGGLWISHGLSFFFESLEDRPFKYYEHPTTEEIFHLSQQSKCPIETSE